MRISDWSSDVCSSDLSELAQWETNNSGQNPSVRYPTVLYNRMIAPLVPFTIRGITWYQGESNSDRPKAYPHLFPALIESWRNDWKRPLPFYYVQLAPHFEKGPLKIGRASCRERGCQ